MLPHIKRCILSFYWLQWPFYNLNLIKVSSVCEWKVLLRRRGFQFAIYIRHYGRSRLHVLLAATKRQNSVLELLWRDRSKSGHLCPARRRWAEKRFYNFAELLLKWSYVWCLWNIRTALEFSPRFTTLTTTYVLYGCSHDLIVNAPCVRYFLLGYVFWGLR